MCVGHSSTLLSDLCQDSRIFFLDSMSGLRNFIHSTYKSAAEKVLPARTQSAFKEKGVRTSTAEQLIASVDPFLCLLLEQGPPLRAIPHTGADARRVCSCGRLPHTDVPNLVMVRGLGT